MRNILSLIVIFVVCAFSVTLIDLPIAAINLPLFEQSIFPPKTSDKKTTSDKNNNPGQSVGEKKSQTGNSVLDSDSEKPSPNSIKTHKITDPENILVLVNKNRYLSSDYVPTDLIQPDIPFSFNEDLPKKLMRKEAADALTSLFQQASAEGIALLGVSGYRSYYTQKSIFDYKTSQVGKERANRVSAQPGFSEHQTGLAMDITCPSVAALKISFGSTSEGEWVAKNAYKFGFIIRYPKGKETITGYDYEPWHLRYVGVEVAHLIQQKNITLDEYLIDPS